MDLSIAPLPTPVQGRVLQVQVLEERQEDPELETKTTIQWFFSLTGYHFWTPKTVCFFTGDNYSEEEAFYLVSLEV
jgi:hypothetical protein